MTSNVLPLHFAPSQASSSQNSNLDDKLEIKYAQPVDFLDFSYYGYTACGVFNEGIQNEKGLWLKINI